MASLTVRETPFVGYTSQVPFDCEDYVGNGFWTQRSVQNGFPCFSAAQVEVISWRLLGTAALIGAGALVGLAAFEIVVLPVALYAIPSLILASYAFWHSTTIDDYDHEEEIMRMRNDAQRMTLDQVAERFEWHKIFEDRILSPSQFVNLYRRQVQSMGVNELVNYYEKVSRHAEPFNESAGFSYAVPHPREHAAKWRTETQNKTFEEIISGYPLDKLERLGMIDYSELQKIRELLVTYRIAESGFNAQKELADQEFEQTIAPCRQALDQSLESIEAIYNTNEAVRASQGFQNREMLARLEIENGSATRLREAREQHQQRIAVLYPNRRVIARENLTPPNRAIYDRSFLELHRAEQTIAQDLQQRLAQHDANFSRQRTELNVEIQRVRETCDRMRASSQERFRQDILPAEQARERRLQPHLEQFGRIATDLDRTYRAYLRQLRAIR